MVEVEIELPQGGFSLAVSFASDAGVTALFGGSGSGKTTTVDCIAGLRRPLRGRIVVDGLTLFDSDKGIDLPARRRRVGYVFQDGRLFPHLTVRRNLLYGPRFGRRRERPFGGLDDVVGLLGLGPLLERRPGTLSGGERQRVAIGRALLAGPRLLLMDEPLAALDAARKAEILPYLDRLRAASRVPIVYVSHAADEVARLAGTVVLLEAGRVVATGPPTAVLPREGAGVEGRVLGHDEARGLTLVEVAGQRLEVPRLEAAAGARLRLQVGSAEGGGGRG